MPPPPSGAGDGEGADEEQGEESGAWPASHGGHTTYLTADEELLTVLPRGNALSLVALAPGLLSFVKLVSRARAVAAPRYDVSLRFAGRVEEGEEAAAATATQKKKGKVKRPVT